MRHVVEALRLAFDHHRSRREIAAILAVSQSTVHAYLVRFQASGLPWPLPETLDEAALEARLFTRGAFPPPVTRPVPDWAAVHQELKRKGVTLQLLWAEYKEAAAELARCYQYTQFCRHYQAWAGTLEPVLRQVHIAGERLFVDYAGPTMPVVHPRTGEIADAQIFVGALGASHLLYVEATWTQTLPDWIGAHVRMLDYVGGVPALIVPDNLKSAVRQPCYYEPTVHATYQDFATHYGTVILPARAYHPRDKAKVETAVQIVEREILAPLRHDVFHSLAELNHALAYRREQVNDRPFQKLAGSRRSVFEASERATLRPLPLDRYELAEWKTAKVNIDYHISVEGHLYSVPYRLVGAEVTVRLTATMLEVLQHGTRVAAHARSTHKGRYTTEPTHRPTSHQQHRPATGKMWLACALGQSACRQGHTVRYVRLPRLLSDELVLARADGSYGRLMQTMAKTDLLILDDWGLAPLGDREGRDLLELVEERAGRRATLVTSQLPIEHWHEMIGDATFGDAILDRLVHHAHRLTLTGGSLR